MGASRKFSSCMDVAHSGGFLSFLGLVSDSVGPKVLNAAMSRLTYQNVS
jgi:hypothetical protein